MNYATTVNLSLGRLQEVHPGHVSKLIHKGYFLFSSCFVHIMGTQYCASVPVKVFDDMCHKKSFKDHYDKSLLKQLFFQGNNIQLVKSFTVFRLVVIVLSQQLR